MEEHTELKSDLSNIEKGRAVKKSMQTTLNTNVPNKTSEIQIHVSDVY